MNENVREKGSAYYETFFVAAAKARGKRVKFHRRKSEYFGNYNATAANGKWGGRAGITNSYDESLREAI